MSSSAEYDVGIDRWCENIRSINPDLAVETISIPLSIKEGIAFSRHHTLSLPEPNDNDSSLFSNIRDNIHKAFLSLVKTNENNVAFKDEPSVFVKLSTRSPKDVIYEEKNEKVNHFLLTELEKVKYNRENRIPIINNKNDEENEQLRRKYFQSFAIEGWLSACSLAFECNSVDDVLNLLLDSTRVNFDLNRVLNYMGVDDDEEDEDEEDKNDFNNTTKDIPKDTLLPLSIVIRKWYPRPLYSEFRCFVYNGALTAVSQYYDKCFFHEVIENETEILDEIRTHFATVFPILSNKLGNSRNSFIMDVSIIPSCYNIIDVESIEIEEGNEDEDDEEVHDENESGGGGGGGGGTRRKSDMSSQSSSFQSKVQLLEINPFESSTSACLFDWRQDMAILQGREPFQFRSTKYPSPFASSSTTITDVFDPLSLIPVLETREYLREWVSENCKTSPKTALEIVKSVENGLKVRQYPVSKGLIIQGSADAVKLFYQKIRAKPTTLTTEMVSSTSSSQLPVITPPLCIINVARRQGKKEITHCSGGDIYWLPLVEKDSRKCLQYVNEYREMLYNDILCQGGTVVINCQEGLHRSVDFATKLYESYQ